MSGIPGGSSSCSSCWSSSGCSRSLAAASITAATRGAHSARRVAAVRVEVERRSWPARWTRRRAPGPAATEAADPARRPPPDRRPDRPDRAHDRAVRRGRDERAAPGRAVPQRGVREPDRVQERLHGGRGRRRRGGRRQHGDGRDLHPAGRRRADRHVEHGRDDPDRRPLRDRPAEPDVVLLRGAAICALVGMVTGSSWTTAGTLGVAFVGMAQVLGLDEAVAAGAVICGAYFGDKMTPLSETTILVPSLVGGGSPSTSTSATCTGPRARRSGSASSSS